MAEELTRTEVLSSYVEPGMYVLGYLLSLPKVRTVLELPANPGLNDFDPIYPIQQDPDSGFPYVRYNVSNFTDVNQPWRVYEQMNAAIYSNDMRVAGVIQKEIHTHLAEGGESADRLNQWASMSSNAMTNGEPYFLFYDVTWLAGGEMEPTSEVGGAHARLITLSYSYAPQRWPDVDQQ